MPRSLSWSEVKENKAFQDGIFDACWLRLRPMRVRNVCVSGTKGVGRGIGAALMLSCRQRHCVLEAKLDCANGTRKDGIDRACVGLIIMMATGLSRRKLARNCDAEIMQLRWYLP